jgi:hypothetical protein
MALVRTPGGKWKKVKSTYTYTPRTTSTTSSGETQILPGTTGAGGTQTLTDVTKYTTAYEAIEAGARGSGGGRVTPPTTTTTTEPTETPITPGRVGTAPAGRGGLYTMTPEESARYTGTKPVWTVIGKTPREVIDIETRYAGAVRVSDEFETYGEVPRGQFESNIMQIGLAQEGARREIELTREATGVRKAFMIDPESFKGEPGFVETPTDTGVTFGLGREYFEQLPAYQKYQEFAGMFTDEGVLKEGAYRERLLSAKESFEDLPLGVRLKSTMGEMAVGFAQLGVGIPESMIGYGLQMSVQDPTRMKKFEFGGRAGEIMDIPTVQPSVGFLESPVKYIFETGLERPATSFRWGVVAGVGFYLAKGWVAGVGAYGLKVGTLETAKYLSPLRIASTYWVPDISKEFVTSGKARTVETVYGGGKKAISLTGAKTDLMQMQLRSLQYSETVGKGAAGTSITQINVPYARYIGGELTFGRTTLSFVNVFAGVPVGKYGYKSDVITQRLGGGISRTQTFGHRFDITKQLGDYPKMKVFGFGGGERVGGFERVGQGQYRALFGYEPSLRGYGVSFDYSKAVSTGTGVKVFRGGGVKSSPSYLKQMWGGGTVTTPTTQLKFPVVTGAEKLGGLTKTFGGGKGLVFTGLKTDVKSKVKLGTGLVTGDLTTTLTKTKTKTVVAPLTKVTPIPTYRVGQAVGLAQPQKIDLGLKQIQVAKLTQAPRITTPTLPRFGFKWGGFGGFLLPPMLPPLGYFETKRKRQSLGRGFRYQPGIASIALGIKAPKMPRLAFTGLVTRPIISKRKRRKKRRRRK